jgi:trehalose 6-phosphate synthase/phosphatase
MEAPIAVTLVDDPHAKPVELDIKSEAIFTTAVGHSSKRTLASWHVTTPQEIVEHMLALVADVPYVRTPSPQRSIVEVEEKPSL